MEPAKRKDPETQVEVMLRYFRTNKVTALLIVVGLFLVSFNEVTESSENTLRRLGIIKSFDTEAKTRRGQFSARFVENAWNRMFWMRAYADRVANTSDIEDQHRVYNKYVDASEKWNSQLMNYCLEFDEYYPSSGKRVEIQDSIQPKFKRISSRLNRLRFQSDGWPKDSMQMYVKLTVAAIDSVNLNLYALIDQPSPQK